MAITLSPNLAPDMYFLAKLEPSISLSSDKARNIAKQPKFIRAVCMVLDILARLDQADTETVATKIRPHRLSKMSDDMISQLGQIPDLIEKVAPGTVAAERETGKYKLALSHHPPLPTMGLGCELQGRRDMPDVSNHQACRDVESNEDLSDFNRRPPTRSGVQREAYVPESASAVMKVPGHANVLRQPSNSRLATSPIPLAPCSLAALTVPVIAQGSLIFSPSDPARGACPDRRPADEESNAPTSLTDDQLAPTTIAQRTEASLGSHRSPFAQAFGHLNSLFGATVSPDRLMIVIKTGDTLVRDDAVPFLTDQLPLWRGMWHKSSLLVPTRDDSITDHFVKVSRCLAIINEGSVMDRIRLLLHRVLQYQFYLCFLEEVKQRVKDPEVKRKRGIRDAAYAMNHLLAKLYIDDWDLIGPAEKQRRRNLLHKQKHLGKRLVTLSSCMGFGILLLGSPEAMGHINDTEFTDDMLNALVCYISNRYPEAPKLCKMLDGVVRQMVKSQTIDEMRIYIESIVPSIESFLKSRDGLMPPSQFTRIDLSIYQADPLELFPAQLHNRPDLIQYLRTRGTEIYKEECASRRTCKRRRVSL